MSRWRAVVGQWRGVGPVWFGANRACWRAFRDTQVCCRWAGRAATLSRSCHKRCETWWDAGRYVETVSAGRREGGTSGATSAGWFGLLCRASPVGQRADNRCHLKLCAPTTTRRDCARPAPAPHTTACRDCSRRVPAGRARRSGRRSARRPRRANRWAATAAVKQVATDVLGSVPVLASWRSRRWTTSRSRISDV